jgi:hypothetical protein
MVTLDSFNFVPNDTTAVFPITTSFYIFSCTFETCIQIVMNCQMTDHLSTDFKTWAEQELKRQTENGFGQTGKILVTTFEYDSLSHPSCTSLSHLFVDFDRHYKQTDKMFVNARAPTLYSTIEDVIEVIAGDTPQQRYAIVKAEVHACQLSLKYWWGASEQHSIGHTFFEVFGLSAQQRLRAIELLGQRKVTILIKP